MDAEKYPENRDTPEEEGTTKDSGAFQSTTDEAVDGHMRAARDMICDLPVAAVCRVGNSICINVKAQTLSGYAPEEVNTFDRFFERLFGEDQSAVRAMYESDRRRGFPEPRSITLRRKDGSRRYIEIAAQTNKTCEIWLMNDVTEHIRTQEALRKSSTILSKAENLTLLGGWEWDFETDIYVVSKGWQRIHGVDREWLKREELGPIAYADDLPLIDKVFYDALEGKCVYDLEHRITHQKTGEVRYVRAYGEIIRDAQGKPYKMYGASQDITQQKRAVEALRTSKQHFKTLVENLPYIISRFDPQLRHLYVSPNIEEVTGIPQEDFIGKTNLEMGMDETLATNWMDALQQTFEQKTENHIEYSYPTAEGRRYFSAVLVPEFSEGGEVISVMGVNQDVTEQRRLAQELLESQKMAGIGNLAAGMAHEINNPLQVVTGNTESILKSLELGILSTNDLERKMMMIQRNSWRIAELIRLLLKYAHPYAENVESLNPNELIRDVLKSINERFKFREDIRIVSELQTSLPLLTCDRKQATEAIISLLENGRDAMPDGGVLTIRSAYDSHRDLIQLSVSDTGIGIPEEHMDKLFDPFFTTRQPGQGMGLGLPLVRSILQAHGGVVEVQSQPYQGTIFTLSFPADFRKKTKTFI